MSLAVHNLPARFEIGESIDGAADWVGIGLAVELPYWLMVPNCNLKCSHNAHCYPIEIRDDYAQFHQNPADDSGAQCIYFGPMPPPDRVVEELISYQTLGTWRKCKTVLLISTRCNIDAIHAHEGDLMSRHNQAKWYLRSLCDAHIELINHVVQRYRLATYDQFAYELSPWDISIAFIFLENEGMIRVPLLDYAEMDSKPFVMDFKDIGNPAATRDPVKYIEPEDLESALSDEPSAGEYDLIDAINLMIRGDYSGAVRRVTTAIEAITEYALRTELLKRYTPTEVEERLLASQNDFPGRFRQLQKLSGISVAGLDSELERTRQLRHEIVHKSRRLSFEEREVAQRSVDTGRWLFNKLENNPDRTHVRDSKIAFRSLGRHQQVLRSALTADGVAVYGPWPDEPKHEEIAIAAYYLWENVGCQVRKDVEYWLAAEKQLRKKNWEAWQSSRGVVEGATSSDAN